MARASISCSPGCASREDLGRDFGAGLSEREVDYLIEQEWAETADDILWRRSKLGLQHRGEEAAPRSTAYLAPRSRNAAGGGSA